MNTGLIALFSLLFPIFLSAQDNTIVKYYRDIQLKNETLEQRAKYKVVLTIKNETSIRELFDIKADQLLWRKSYRYTNPEGVWYFFDQENLQKDSVVYGRYKPQGFYSYDPKEQKLIENMEGEFINPSFIGADEKIQSIAKKHNTSEISVWISVNINYPIEAQFEGIQGIVQAQFTIDENGFIGCVMITESMHEILDKETYRLLNSLPRVQPAKLNGEPINLYIETPITFLLN